MMTAATKLLDGMARAIEAVNRSMPEISASFMQEICSQRFKFAAAAQKTEEKTNNKMKKSELFRLIYRNSRGDCTDVYDSELLRPFSVKELVEAVLEDENEWGYIKIGSNILPSSSLEYSHGKIVNNNISATDLEKTVKSLDAGGGWSRMDFIITISSPNEIMKTPKESIEKIDS